MPPGCSRPRADASSARDGSRCCCRTPAIPVARARRRGGARRALEAVGASGMADARSARPVRRASASAWRSRSSTRAAEGRAGLQSSSRWTSPRVGWTAAAKAELAQDLRRRAEQGQAVIVATHDPEFAAACATRAVLLADGRVIADGPRPSCSLAAGTSRPRPLASSAAPAARCCPRKARLLLRARMAAGPGQRRRRRRSAGSIASFAVVLCLWCWRSAGSCYERAPTVRADASRSWARSPPSPRSAATRSSPLPDVKPITAITLVVGFALGPLPVSPSARSAC